MEEIINKVSESKIISFDMEEVLPKENEILVFDLSPFLFQGIVLKEKEFRQSLKTFDWEPYRENAVLVLCSTHAIVPIWAYMLVSTYLQDVKAMYSTSKEDIYLTMLRNAVQKLNTSTVLEDRPIVIKGCSNIPFKESLYLETTKLFLPLAKSIMYGEPCSTVPIFKRK